MSKSTKPVSPATAADVRAWFNDKRYGPSRVKRLPEGTNLACITSDKPRGRLNPAVVAVFNDGRPEGAQYVSGATSAAKAAKAAQAKSLRDLAVQQGIVKPGSRGPLPKAFLASQG